MSKSQTVIQFVFQKSQVVIQNFCQVSIQSGITAVALSWALINKLMVMALNGYDSTNLVLILYRQSSGIYISIVQQVSNSVL